MLTWKPFPGERHQNTHKNPPREMDSTGAAQLWGDEAGHGDTSAATQLPPPKSRVPHTSPPSAALFHHVSPRVALSSEPYRHVTLLHRSTLPTGINLPSSHTLLWVQLVSVPAGPCPSPTVPSQPAAWQRGQAQPASPPLPRK